MATRIVTGLPNTEFTIADGNFDTSRKPIDRIIIHTTVSSAQSAIAHFGDSNAKVSAHYIVGLDGKLYHGLEETFTAYHAGVYAMNQRSIGIEHEDNGDFNGVRPDTLYKTSSALVRDVCLFYGIPIDRTHILKHSEVKATGCPDALDIDRIVREAQAPTQDLQTQLDEVRKQRDDTWNLYQGEVSKNGELTKTNQEKDQQLQNLRDAFDKQTQADAETGKQLLDVSHERDGLQSTIDNIAKELGTTPDEKLILGAIQALKTPHDEVVKQVVPLMDKLFQAAAYKRLPKKTQSIIKSILDFFHL